MEACLRHYMLEYHVDGFILNPDVMPVEGVYSDPMLRGLKLLKHQTGFQNVMRRFLKGDEHQNVSVHLVLHLRSYPAEG